MTSLKSRFSFVLLCCFVFSVKADEAGIYLGGDEGESAAINELLVYPGIKSMTVVYHLGKKRAFRLRYGKNIDPKTFQATINGKNISHKFHPVPGSEENVFLRLKRGQNKLNLQVTDINAAAYSQSSFIDTDAFEIELRGVQAKGNMLTTPPPGFEVETLPPGPPEDRNKPVFIIKSKL